MFSTKCAITYKETSLSNLIALTSAGFLKSISTHGCLSIITVGIHVDVPKRGKLDKSYQIIRIHLWHGFLTFYDLIVWPFACVQTKLWFGNLQPSPDLVFLKSSLRKWPKNLIRSLARRHPSIFQFGNVLLKPTFPWMFSAWHFSKFYHRQICWWCILNNARFHILKILT